MCHPRSQSHRCRRVGHLRHVVSPEVQESVGSCLGTPYGEETRRGQCPEQQLIAQRPSTINQAREVLCQGRFPASLNICAYCEPISPLSRRLLCRFPLVILQQAAQSFSTPHCSRVPSRLRVQRKQDPIAFALMVALFVIMYGILMQGSPQRGLSNQDEHCQAFLFD